MKRKTLTTAVLAGLTGMAGMVSVSNAVNLNPDGLGQVLLYPYYSARGGNDTLISIVNTSDEAKSVKVRFLEGLNSREVLDFNLYMSPFDVWVAAVTEADNGGGKIIIPDTSCTVPYLFEITGGDDFGEQPFLAFAYTGPNDDGGPQGIERTASGYIEVIEMGTLTDETEGSATAATHVDGVPADCDQLVDAWTDGGDNPYWLVDDEIDHEPPSGGLFGAGSIINVADGTMFSYNAVAISNWSTAIQHTNPGTVLPDLSSGDSTSNVFFEGQANVDTQVWLSGVEAVSATILYEQIMNEYVIGGDAAGLSEWVVTFPTKRFYADDEFSVDALGEPAPVAPFTVAWGQRTEGVRESAGACEPVNFRFWDREERELEPDDPDPIGPIVSPPPPEPPPVEVPVFELCFETNVIRFSTAEDIPNTAEITKEARFTTFPLADAGFNSGWVRFDFSEKQTRSTAAGIEYVGLPTIGFWVNTFTNGTLEGGTVLANYGGSFQHRGSRRLQAAEAS